MFTPKMFRNLLAYVPSDLVPPVVGSISASRDRVLKNVDVPVTVNVFEATRVPFTVVDARDTVPVAYRLVVDRLDVDALFRVV